jgi:hypothetical protein
MRKALKLKKFENIIRMKEVLIKPQVEKKVLIKPQVEKKEYRLIF